MHTDYLNPAIRQLRDQQVRFAPREKKIEQVDAGRAAAGRVGPGADLSLRILCYRITNFRPESYPDLKLSGQEASHDLRLFVEDVSESADVPAEAAGERVLTVEELASQFNVSTKTISRWRRQGLVSRRFVLDGRKRVGFLQSSVDRFVEQNQERVRRGAQFSQLTDEERATIIERARRLARAGGCPADVTKRLARKTGRSAETIRYTLKQFDQRPSRGGRLSRQPRAAAGRRPSGRSTSSTSTASRSRRWPSGSAAREPASTGSSPRCAPSGSWTCRWTTFPATSSPGSARRRREERHAGAASRVASRRRRSRGCPAACRPIWPACTKCRC